MEHLCVEQIKITAMFQMGKVSDTATINYYVLLLIHSKGNFDPIKCSGFLFFLVLNTCTKIKFFSAFYPDQ